MQPGSELQVMSTNRRRLSSPIINPNFEEDFDATALTTTTNVNTDHVLASMSAGLTLTSSTGLDDVLNDLTVTSLAGRDDVLNDVGCPLDRDESSSSSSDRAATANYIGEREAVNAVGFSIIIIIIIIIELF